MALRLRSARASDAHCVAAIQLASWRDTYRGILDDAFLDGPLEAELLAHWEDMIAQRRRAGVVILATAAGGPVGFVAAWREGRVALVDNLHVRPGVRGAGIGRALLGFAAQRLQTQGCTTVELTVFAANEGALRFYRALRATIGPEEPGVTHGQQVPERRCAWPAIETLIAAAARPKSR